MAHTKECDQMLAQQLASLNQAIRQQRPDIQGDELVRAYQKSIKGRRTFLAASGGDGLLSFRHFEGTSQMFVYSFLFVVFLFFATPLIAYVIEQILQIRCFVPNNYIIWEATR